MDYKIEGEHYDARLVHPSIPNGVHVRAVFDVLTPYVSSWGGGRIEEKRPTSFVVFDPSGRRREGALTPEMAVQRAIEVGKSYGKH